MKGRPWTEEEIQLVREKYATTFTPDLAKELGRSSRAVYMVANKQGLRKLDTEKLNFARLYPLASRKTQFKPGFTPWNKGKKGYKPGGRSANGYFKPGHMPPNLKYDGAITVRTDKLGNSYQYIRVSLSRWKVLHRYLWEQAHGPIPKGLIIVFRDRNTMNATLENLELITRAENMRRNSIVNYPPELQGAIRLYKKLKKRIDEKQDH